jgi:phosphatidylinositol-3-phosphatase
VRATGLLLLLVLTAAAIASGCGSHATPTVSGSTRTADSGTPCGTRAEGSASYRHVVWVWMENKSYDSVIGSGDAPYLNRLASECGLATNYRNVAHPSLPNYVAATSGLEGPAALDRFRSDCDPQPGCTTSAKSIFSQAPTWKAYQESMPRPCDRENSGEYAVRHNPPLYFTSVKDCRARDVVWSSFRSDLANDSLPAFSFVTPNVCSDSHDCPADQADKWLAAEMTKVLDSPAYRGGETALFITYDEGEAVEPAYCSQMSPAAASNADSAGCHVATVVVSPTTGPGTRSGKSFDHYSLLRTAEDLLGLPPLGAAADAKSMVDAFGLD